MAAPLPPKLCINTLVCSESQGFFDFPSLIDEENTYIRWGWSRTPGDQTFEFSSSPFGGLANVHNDTEGDDLWAWALQNQRYASALTLAWQNHWRSQNINNLISALDANDGPAAPSGYGYDHIYGQGLAMLREFNGDTAGDATMAALMTRINDRFQRLGTPAAMAYWGSRGPARWLIVACYVAEVTQNAADIALRDSLIDAWMTSTDWEDSSTTNIVTGGSYFVSREQAVGVNPPNGGGNYDAGRRFNSTFSVGLHTEALWRAFLVTGRADIRTRLIQLAEYVRHYAHRPSWQFPNVGSRFGHEGNGSGFYENDGDGTSVNRTSKDCSYDTALVNSQVFGYKLTGDVSFLSKAQTFLSRGTHFAAGHPADGGGARRSADDEVDHFLDTMNNPDGNYFDYNKGELQYAYQVFENGGLPALIG
ncbi:MAG: hypothetical protein OES46_21615 [Gammaproteobacteria bacterium]|nr:hypothetical protein [Gammaproteobacteria bacterium]